MFYCAMCGKRFSLEDVKEARYFPSTGGCLSCYQDMAKNKSYCFASRRLYDPKSLGCKECPDQRLCSIFVSHPKNSMKER